MLVATILLLAGVGYGIGLLAGSTTAFVLAGGALGFVLGMALVIVSFRDR